MSQDYKNTLNLPQTDFSMQAGLPKKSLLCLKNGSKMAFMIN